MFSSFSSSFLSKYMKIIQPKSFLLCFVYSYCFSVSVLCIRLAFSVALLSSKVLSDMKSYLKLEAKKALSGKKKKIVKNQIETLPN